LINEAGNVYPYKEPNFFLKFSGLHVAQSLVFCVVFYILFFVFCDFSFCFVRGQETDCYCNKRTYPWSSVKKISVTTNQVMMATLNLSKKWLQLNQYDPFDQYLLCKGPGSFVIFPFALYWLFSDYGPWLPLLFKQKWTK
jgi:hypothetical protein